jgi:undecaprenyl-diphosphatase
MSRKLRGVSHESKTNLHPSPWGADTLSRRDGGPAACDDGLTMQMTPATPGPDPAAGSLVWPRIAAVVALDRSARLDRSAKLDRTLVALTQAANYSRLWLALASVIAVFGGGRGRAAAAHGIGAVAIAATIANGPAKLLVRRRRPARRSKPALIRMPRSTSFPSGHSASAFAFATGASSRLPALTPVLVPLAGAVAYSRVRVGVHHPSDVVAGAALGIGSAALASVTTAAALRSLQAGPGEP